MLPLEFPQLATLFASLCGLIWLVGANSEASVYPYVGLAIASAGISISFQQLYIFSRVRDVVSISRREFYRSTSFSLMILGASLFLKNTALILKQNTPDAHKVAITNSETFARLLFNLALPFLANLLISYLYPRTESRGPNGPTSGTIWSKWKWIVSGDTHLISRSHDLSKWEKFILILGWRVIAWASFVAALYGLWELLSHGSQTVRDASTNDPNRPFPLTTVATHILTTLVILHSGFLILRRFDDLVRRRASVTGFAMFIFFIVLFASPPVTQNLLCALYTKEIPYGWPVPFAAIAIIIGYYVIRWTKSVPWPELSSPLQAKHPESSVYFWTFVGISFFLIFDGTIIHSFKLHLDPLNTYSLESLTFGFFAFGCAWMTAVDLELAATSYQQVKEEYASDLFLSQVAHEIFNPIRPVHTFLTDEDLLTLLSTSQTDPKLDNSRQALQEFHPAIVDAVRRIITYTQQLQEQTSIGGKPQRFDLVTVTSRFIEEQFKPLMKRPEEEVEIRFQPEEPTLSLPILANRDAWISILRILLDNAVEATDPKRKNLILVALKRNIGGDIEVTIKDSGIGMPDDQAIRYGQPRFTTKNAGWGMGVHTAQLWTQRKMGGLLRLSETKPGVGTEIQIILPKPK